MLSASSAPAGVELLDDLEETVVATVTAPTEIEEPEEIEEEAAEVGGGREPPRARRPPRRVARRAPPRAAKRASRSSSCACFAAGGRALRSTSCSSGSATRARATPAPATTSASRSRTCSPQRWELPKRAEAFGGLMTDGRIGPGMPRVAVLLPQTYMNESGRAVGPARGSTGSTSTSSSPCTTRSTCRSARCATRKGGGTAGHNGLKSLKQGLGRRRLLARAGRGGPARTRPIRRSSRQHVLSRFTEPRPTCGADRARRGRDRALCSSASRPEAA